MNRNLLVIFLLFIGFAACKNKAENEGRTQMQQVMAIHDEVMPEMGTIAKLVGQLKPKVDSTAQGKKYEEAMNDLQDSHKSMMEWMKGFGERFNSDEILNGAPLSEEKQKWLDEEEEKVNKLKDQILESIANAREVLED